MRIVALFTSLILMSCTPRPEPPDTVPTADRLVGTVRVVGSAPLNVHVVLQTHGGGSSIGLAGPLRTELQQLAGAEVAVVGNVERSPDPMIERQVQVVSYEIVSVDGLPVTAGTVEGHVNDWTLLRTAGGDLVYLTGVAERFRIGQKIWVQGPEARIVQSFGVLKE